MHRHQRDADLFSVIHTFDSYVKRRDLSFTDDGAAASLLNDLSVALEQHRVHSARLYGLRTEAMFAHVAAALGQCKLISEEDSGSLFDDVGTMRRPDFRIVTLAGHQFLVEVKNFHPNDAIAPYTFEQDYVDSLVQYATACEAPLKIAIYWSRWGFWTLNPIDQLKEVDGKLQISMLDAMADNEFYLLGDCWLGTTPPLSLRIHADRTAPRGINEDGTYNIRINDLGIYADGVRLTDEIERKLAWFCILNGDWTEITQPAEINDGLVDYIELQVEPDPERVEDPDQNFQIIGILSQMISRQFVRATSSEGTVSRLTPSAEPSQLGVLIPNDYKGDGLKLWRFTMHPRSRSQEEILASIS